MAPRKKGWLERTVINIRKITRKVPFVISTAARIISQEQLEEAENPADMIDVLLSEIPKAIILTARSETQQERRLPIPAKVKKAVLERDGYACVCCKHKSSLNIHHYIRVADGGKNTTDNLVTICPNCHLATHSGMLKIRKPKKVRGVD